jgi:hypothetical protein
LAEELEHSAARLRIQARIFDEAADERVGEQERLAIERDLS